MDLKKFLENNFLVIILLYVILCCFVAKNKPERENLLPKVYRPVLPEKSK